MSTYTEQSSTKRMKALSSLAQAAPNNADKPLIRHMIPALILSVFFAVLLLALIASVMVYKSLTDTQTQTNTARENIGLIYHAVRANDATNAIAVGQGPEGQSLVIRETTNTDSFETRFYLYNDAVLQEYSLASSFYTPEKASRIIESNTFYFSYSSGLLSVTTDYGTTQIALRSLPGGE